MRNYKIITGRVHPATIDGHDALFRALFDDSPDAIFLLHPVNFMIIDCNAKAMQLFQAQEKADLISRESFSLYDSEPVEFSKSILIDNINKGKEHSQELAFRSIRGNVFWGRTSIRKVNTMTGSLIIFRVRRVVDYMKTAEMLSSMINHTAKATGLDFFNVLTELLSKNFGVSMAMVAQIDADHTGAKSLSCWYRSDRMYNMNFNLETSPSLNVLKGYTTFYPSNLRGMFPGDPIVRELEMESYLGTPVFCTSGEVCGLLILMDEKVMEEIPNARYILSLFASRCGAEFERIVIEESYRKKIFELGGTVEW
jgi:PAS domain S-box-containing protein